jgi:shikimate kinase
MKVQETGRVNEVASRSEPDATERATAQESCSPGERSGSPGTIFLIGPRGSGKTTVARLLADRLRWAWLDADVELEREAGRSIRVLFAQEGESAFREREADLLRKLCQRRGYVIATGGGVVLREANRHLLRGNGAVVWLTADVDTLWARLQSDHSTLERRPQLTAGPGAGGREEIEQVLRHREPHYRACAHHSIITAGRDPADLATEIAAWWLAGPAL